MNKINYLWLLIFTSQFAFAQSSVVYEAGTIIEVTAGADICADNVTILGTYTGTGTLCNGPLPVELSLFTAEVKDNKVNLYWKTETEVNNYGFEIERHVVAGKSDAGDWKKIGFAEGYGNSNSPKEYFYTDDKLFGGSRFKYRLKQIDNEGQFEYSDVVEVEIIPEEFALFQNFPNPFNPTTVISYQLPVNSDVTLKVFDVLGNEIATMVDEFKIAGRYEIQFNATTLTSGVYIYRLNVNDFVSVKKTILLR
jgi:hypothetical protein